MKTLRKPGLWLAGLMGCAMALPVAAEPHALQLLGRTGKTEHRVGLSEADWAWLRNKRTLVLGSAEPDYVPFEITTTGSDLEGISADFAKILADVLHVDVEVRRYESRAEAVQAVKTGEVDLLGTSSGIEGGQPDLAQSQAYVQDQSVLVTRTESNGPLPAKLAGKRIALFDHYLAAKTVQAFYPKAQLQLYSSDLEAIGAVAFGRADVYLGNYISANYLINKNYLNNVQLADFSGMEASTFSFGIASGNTRLTHLVNTVLESLSVNERAVIMHRWSAGSGSVQGHQNLQLSADERHWIQRHPVVSVLVNDNLPPLSFFDDNGVYRGVTADVLAKISLRTGIKFEVRRGRASQTLLDDVKSGDADLLAAFIPNYERGNELRFTRPYLTTPLVLVTPGGAKDTQTLDDLAGKRLAVIHSNMTQDFLARNFPAIHVLTEETAAEALGMAVHGTADAAIVPLISARYLLARHYAGQLSISSTVGDEPARFAFGTNRGALELYSIMDKALLSIPPDEMDEVTNRWRNEVVIGESFWGKYGGTLFQGGLIVISLLLMAAWWIAHLRGLVRRLEGAEKALSNQIEFKRALVNGTPHPLYVRDREGRMISCNASYLAFFKFTREDVIGKRIIDMENVDPVVGRAYHDECMSVMASGEPLLRDRRLVTMFGDEIAIYHWLLPYHDSDGEVVGVISGWLDISERERLLNDAQQAKYAAEEANRAKTTFFATLSHEIRTPMNAVIGMLELAMKKADQGILDRMAIDVASDAAQNMLELISDILDVARLESGRLTLAPERINLQVQVECLLNLFEGLARQKQLLLISNITEDANCDVLLDTLRFKQIVSNILSNAIKFTHEGEIRLVVDAHANFEGSVLSVRLLIEDTGSGISVEDQRHLFQPFAQGSNNAHGGRNGSGLGLVISRNLCEMMGGELRMNSILGKGTQIEMRFELPILEPVDAVVIPPEELTEQPRVLNILVVDDYPANRLLMGQQLAYLGHRVEDASDGARGLSAWRNGRFDVIITDCNMPIIDGYDMARAIREEELKKGLGRCLILGFTASVHADEKQRCLDAGMDDCLAKPISLKVLSERLAGVETETVVQPLLESGLNEPEGRFNIANLELLTRGDPESLKTLLIDLANSNDEDLAQLAGRYLDQDLQGLQDLAHRVKGGARIIKAKWLITACEQLEATCMAAVDTQPERLEQAAANLAQEMTTIADALKAHCRL